MVPVGNSMGLWLVCNCLLGKEARSKQGSKLAFFFGVNFLQDFGLFLMVFLNVALVFSSVLKACKIVLDGSKCVCGGSKAVLVSKVPLLF